MGSLILLHSFFTNFDPQLKIEAAKGKAMKANDPLLIKVKHLPEIEVATECIEDQALAVYHDKRSYGDRKRCTRELRFTDTYQ